MPDGSYIGSVEGFPLATPWRGKKFDAKAHAGINLLRQEDTTIKKYSFKTYVSESYVDYAHQVIHIDYNIPQNPFWLRIFQDEIVLTSTDNFLGRLEVRPIPQLTFSLGYFTLEK